MKITEWMDDVKVDEEFIDKIVFQNNNKYSKRKIKKLVFQKIGKNNNNLFQIYGRRAVVAAATCAVIVSVTFGWNIKEKYSKQLEMAGSSKNSFTIYATAAESVPVLFRNIVAEGSMSGSEENNYVSYDKTLPLYCKGNNIKTITYKINTGAFYIKDCPYVESIISKKDVPSDSIYRDGLKEAIICTELTIDYKLQPKPEDETRFISIIGKKETPYSDAVISSDVNRKKLLLDDLYKNLEIECIVHFNDGSKQSKKIHIENKIMTWQEAFPDDEVAKPNEKEAFAVLICEQ